MWQSHPYYMVGQELKGAICVDTSCNPGESITLYLRGFDDCTSWHKFVKNKRRFLKREYAENKFLEIKLPIVHFTSSNTPKARTAYPFSFALPDDLAQSVTCLSTKIKAL